MVISKQKWNLVLRDEADRSVAEEIFRYKEYRAAKEVIRKAEHPIIDAGAHAGFFSLYCRSLNPEVEIYALEPEQNNFELLNKHFKINNISRVHPLQLAIAAQTGERELLLSPDSHNHTITSVILNEVSRANQADRVPPKASAVTPGSLKAIVVQTISLPEIFRKLNVPEISLLKMDVEGAEYEIIESLSKDDFAEIKAIILEYHRLAGDEKVIETTLRENGFSVQIFPSRFDKTMGFIFALNKRKAPGNSSPQFQC